MKFAEYLVFAALLIPTGALLAAAVISLTAESVATEPPVTYPSVMASYWTPSGEENQP